VPLAWICRALAAQGLTKGQACGGKAATQLGVGVEGHRAWAPRRCNTEMTKSQLGANNVSIPPSLQSARSTAWHSALLQHFLVGESSEVGVVKQVFIPLD